ncbi:MAG: hypothetical protein JXR88_05045 [Clostridia bacterium]|nr:hypothetical protein [Clostridia bacterium]
MKVCIKCGCEHEDFVSICSECQGELIDSQDDHPEEMVYIYQDLTLLKNCESNEEANLLISLLNNEGITASIQYQEAGSYLNIVHGRSFQGADVMVPKEDLALSQSILRVFQYDNASHIPDADLDQELKQYLKKKHFIGSVLLLMIIIPMAFGLLMSFVTQ